VLVVASIIPEGNETGFGQGARVIMLVNSPDGNGTEAAFAQLFATQRAAAYPNEATPSIIEAVTA